MYRGDYNHRLNEICNWMLEQVIRVAKELGPNKIWADKYKHIWLWRKQELDKSVFLANDDIRTGYHLSRWGEEAPEPLRQLCKDFINRNLLKSINIENLSREKQLEALAAARKLAESAGANPDLSCGIRYNKLHGYSPYKSGLRRWDGEDLKPLEKESLLINQLITPSETTWLIHPKEINVKLKAKLSNINN